MSFPLPQHTRRKADQRFGCLSAHRDNVPTFVASEFASRLPYRMQHSLRRTCFFLCLVGLCVGGCSEKASVSSGPSSPVTPVPLVGNDQILPEPPSQIAESVPADEPEPDPPVDPSVIERRFLAAANDPAARIAAIRELANATPAAALTQLNRLFPIERREDVKSEMLAVLADLDHTRERDNQLALCIKALAPAQPTRIRYIAVHTLVDLRDPRARGLLIPLQRDPEREIRAAATQALSDLAQ